MLRYELSWQEAAITSACLVGSAIAMRLAARALADRTPPGGKPVVTDSAAPDAAAPGAATLAAGVGGAGVGGRVRGVAAFVQEAGIVLALFALWQLAGSHPAFGVDGAIGRAQWLWHTERVLHMPSETTIQRAFLPHPLLVQAANLYYAGLHFAGLIICLTWLFIWHRASYPRVRTTVVLFTFMSLAVQFIPVAPPRMLPGDGLIDTAITYGQSVYGSDAGFNPDQLSAMPSVHIGWALLIAVVVVHVSRSRWRWLALGYPVLTTLAVVVTANHYWLDGLAAAALLALALLMQRAGQALRRRYLNQASAAAAARAAVGSAAAIRESAASSWAADRNQAS
ncbi:MAG TPA: phosphatase PAP2 family protein [Streptosporangiaceae bacterium]